MISHYSANPSFEGQRLGALAAKAGVAPEEYALQLLEKGDASCAVGKRGDVVLRIF